MRSRIDVSHISRSFSSGSAVAPNDGRAAGAFNVLLDNLCATNILMLADGRRLGYAEYGDPDGKTVILFHGNPNSRLLYGLMPGCPFRPGLHLIAPDRPGYGLSDFYPPGRGVADYLYDIVALADALGIDKFAVFGPSGGGPSALACAWKIPERLTAVGIFGSVGPFTPQSAEGINPSLRVLFRLAPRAPSDTSVANGLNVILDTPLSRSVPQTDLYRADGLR